MRPSPNPSWGHWLIALPALAIVAVLLGFPTPIRGLLVLITLLTCPGIAVIPFLRTRSTLAQLTLAIVASLAVNTLVSQLFLLSGLWHPNLILFAIWGISVLAAAWHWSFLVPELTSRAESEAPHPGGPPERAAPHGSDR